MIDMKTIEVMTRLMGEIERLKGDELKGDGFVGANVTFDGNYQGLHISRDAFIELFGEPANGALTDGDVRWLETEVNGIRVYSVDSVKTFS